MLRTASSGVKFGNLRVGNRVLVENERDRDRGSTIAEFSFLKVFLDLLSHTEV